MPAYTLHTLNRARIHKGNTIVTNLLQRNISLPIASIESVRIFVSAITIRYKDMTNFTLPKEPVYTVGANTGNQITKEYYNFLVGNINRGIIIKAVCAIHYPKFDYTTYHLISL